MLIDLRTEGLNIYFLCPFLGCFCLIAASFSSGQSVFGKYNTLENILVSFSEILAIIPYLISVKINNESFMNTQKSIEEKKELYNINLDGENNRIRISQGLIIGSANFLRLFFEKSQYFYRIAPLLVVFSIFYTDLNYYLRFCVALYRFYKYAIFNAQ